MHDSAIDTVLQAIPDFAGCSGYERLGIPLTAIDERRRELRIGPGSNFRFLLEPDPGSLLHAAWNSARAAGKTSFAVGLRVDDLDAEVRRLAIRGIAALRGELFPGTPAAYVPIEGKAGANLILVPKQASTVCAAAHSFPLRRLDHLACVAHDLEGMCRFWTDVLDVPVAGEIVAPTMVIRQFRFGDAVLELLGPRGDDSPLHKRLPGLISMASWEVADVDAAVAQARTAGFEVPDAAAGVLPGTRIATIPGTALGGINMQLLQYVPS